MIAIVPIFAIGLALADTNKGSALYHECQAQVRVSDAPDRAKLSEFDLLDATWCAAYIDGFTDGSREVCASGASFSTLARVYVAYMDKNPKMMDENKVVGLTLALEGSYSCNKK